MVSFILMKQCFTFRERRYVTVPARAELENQLNVVSSQEQAASNQLLKEQRRIMQIEAENRAALDKIADLKRQLEEKQQPSQQVSAVFWCFGLA